MKVLLTLMVKNESRILRRCLEAGSRHADAVIVCDTGSTDNTVEIARGFTERPLKVVQHEWRNFGHNRTLSFQAAVEYGKELGWDLDETFALVLDGDMVLCGEDPHPLLDKTQPGYCLIQKSGSLEYGNVRFMRLSHSWKCTGVTHEYWDGASPPTMKGVWIDDRGDGGCKSDKFERDARLLSQGLVEEPNNVRYMFYLAQTYKDLGRPHESIYWYKRRVAGGGWDEEVWYAMYMIMENYLRLGNLLKAELWLQRAYEKRPSRVEPLTRMIRAFREKGQNFKAWHYLKLAERIPPSNDVLFVNRAAWGYELDYERTILQYYVSPDREAGVDASLAYLAKYGEHAESVFQNLIFYTRPMALTWKRLEFPVPKGYVSSSIAVQADGLMNVRTVNYTINSQGGYSYPDGIIDTRNFRSQWDFAARTWEGFEEVLVPSDAPRRDNYIRGIEDIRLHNGHFTATTREFSYCDANRIVVGTYPEMKKFRCVKPPTETTCEKNWLPLGHNTYLYDYHPQLRVGKIEGDQLVITASHKVPAWFRWLRGSAPPFVYDGKLWVLVHLVLYSNPRKYLHMFLTLDPKTYVPTGYTRPTTFKHWGIEYSAGAVVHKDELHLFASVWDRESWHGVMPMAECVKSWVALSA